MSYATRHISRDKRVLQTTFPAGRTHHIGGKTGSAFCAARPAIVTGDGELSFRCVFASLRPFTTIPSQLHMRQKVADDLRIYFSLFSV
jgi:hypothetical protein